MSYLHLSGRNIWGSFCDMYQKYVEYVLAEKKKKKLGIISSRYVKTFTHFWNDTDRKSFEHTKRKFFDFASNFYKPGESSNDDVIKIYQCMELYFVFQLILLDVEYNNKMRESLKDTFLYEHLEAFILHIHEDIDDTKDMTYEEEKKTISHAISNIKFKILNNIETIEKLMNIQIRLFDRIAAYFCNHKDDFDIDKFDGAFYFFDSRWHNYPFYELEHVIATRVETIKNQSR